MNVQTLMMRPLENAYGDLEFGGSDRLRLVWDKKGLSTYFSNSRGTICNSRISLCMRGFI